ncbi:MAG: cupin domain-containing protein [Pseudomonadales bacterium]
MEKTDLLPRSRLRPGLALGFVAWSAAMLLLGSLVTTRDDGISTMAASLVDFVVPAAYADEAQASSKQIIRLDNARMGGDNLGEYAPYEPESGNLVARGHEYFYSEDRDFGLGVWESKPGQMTYEDLGYDELMYVLDGELVMTDTEGKIETFGPGEGFVLPKGWSGTLAVPEGGVRKLWVAYMGGKKG